MFYLFSLFTLQSVHEINLECDEGVASAWAASVANEIKTSKSQCICKTKQMSPAASLYELVDIKVLKILV